MKTHSSEELIHASVRQLCKAVRVPAIASGFVSLAEQAVKENQSHVRYLEALLSVENEERDRHAIQNRTRDAQLPRMKTLEEFDFSQAPRIPAAKIRELAEGGYIGAQRASGADRRMRHWQNASGNPGCAWRRAVRNGA